MRVFLPELNGRFTVKPTSDADVHRSLPQQLDRILSWEYERVVQRDWTVAWEGRWYQIEKKHEPLSLAGRKVTVRQRRSGKVELTYRGTVLRGKALPAKPERPKPQPRRVGRTQLSRPAPTHPWRQFGAASGQRYWRGVKAAGRKGRLSARASGRPPLRSGLPASLAERPRELQSIPDKGDIFS